MAKRRKRSSKKSGSKGFFFAILIGICIVVFLVFRQDIMDVFKPRVTKKSVPGTEKAVPQTKKTVTLYFSDDEGEYLAGEKREILKKSSVQEEAKELVTELTHGPRGKLIPTLPTETKLLALELDEPGIAKVSFNRALVKGHPGGSSAELMTVYSVVNSLTLNFPEIKRVQILVEGKEIETITGHLSLRKPLSANPSIIKKGEKN
jgi:spore germination protein GerM